MCVHENIIALDGLEKVLKIKTMQLIVYEPRVNIHLFGTRIRCDTQYVFFRKLKVPVHSVLVDMHHDFVF